jgi:hypothetical protein
MILWQEKRDRTECGEIAEVPRVSSASKVSGNNVAFSQVSLNLRTLLGGGASREV